MRRVIETRRFRPFFRFASIVDSPAQAAAILLIAVGAILRLWQYFANSSLWIDEAALARNIIDRPATGLFRGLDYAQVAPIGFLLAEKGVVTAFGTSEFALRAFPLACGLLSLLLFWVVATRILTGWSVTLAVGLFSLGVPFIYLSSQVKQYSTDVAAAIFALLAGIEISRRSGTAWPWAVAGAAVMWFSHPSLFVFAGIGIALAIVLLTERETMAVQKLLVTGALWASSAAAAALVALRSVTPADHEYFDWFWGAAFVPLPPKNLSDAVWVVNRLTQAFGSFVGMGRATGGLNYRWPSVFMVVALAGVWALWRRQRDVALFIVIPIASVAIVSALRLYPFTGRFLTFLLPGLLLATAAGAHYLHSVWPDRLRFLIPAGLVVLAGVPLYAVASALPPFWLQHVRPVVEHVTQEREASDSIYVSYGAGQAFQYYASRYGLSANWPVIGRCAVGAPRDYLRQLDQFRGRNRVWIVVTTHAYYKEREAALMLEYLDRIGRRLEETIVPGTSGSAIEGAYGYLYDLSDRNRLGAVSSASYPIARALISPPGRWGCYGVDLSEEEHAR